MSRSLDKWSGHLQRDFPCVKTSQDLTMDDPVTKKLNKEKRGPSSIHLSFYRSIRVSICVGLPVKKDVDFKKDHKKTRFGRVAQKGGQ